MTRVRGKLEIIATRIDKIRNDKEGKPEPQANATAGTKSSPTGGLSKRKSILYLDKNRNVIFDANELFDVLDTDNNGNLSFSEINQVLCLSDKQLHAFIANMRAQMPAGYQSTEYDDTVSRKTFVEHFISALSDASQVSRL